MMNKKNSSGAGMFMMEMIVAVFFFILCASACILVFVKADSLSRLAKDTNNGVVVAESVAEVWKAEGISGLELRFHAQGDHNQMLIFWDREWKAIIDETAAEYLAEISWEEEDGLETAQIVVRRTDGEKELFSMTAARYLPDNG